MTKQTTQKQSTTALCGRQRYICVLLGSINATFFLFDLGCLVVCRVTTMEIERSTFSVYSSSNSGSSLLPRTVKPFHGQQWLSDSFYNKRSLCSYSRVVLASLSSSGLQLLLVISWNRVLKELRSSLARISLIMASSSLILWVVVLDDDWYRFLFFLGVLTKESSQLSEIIFFIAFVQMMYYVSNLMDNKLIDNND